MTPPPLSLLDLLSLPFLLAGALFIGAGTAGLLRFPDGLSRLHAVTKTDTAGLGLIAVGVAVREGSLPVAAKLLLIAGLVMIGSAVNCSLMAWQASRDLRGED